MKNKKILITGGAGFIGSRLTNYLVNENEVVAVDIKPRPDNLSSKSVYVKGDVRDKKLMNKLTTGIDYVYHLACDYGGGKYIHEQRAHILTDNLDMYSSVFPAAVKHKVKRIIFPSSALVYHESLEEPAKEDDLFLYPPTQNSYGFVKMVGEYYCNYYSYQYKLPFTILRMFNVYGAGDVHEHVIPNFVKQSLSGVYPFPIIGTGEEVRVFTHVNDIVKAFEIVAEAKTTQNETINLASKYQISIRELAELIWSKVDEREFKVTLTPIPNSTPSKRFVSIEKQRELLDWKPEVGLNEGIEEVIEWIKSMNK